MKLIKHIKKYWKAILIIVVLLVTQATCDLSLPEYTSNIVNIGIQQGGIDSHLPDVMRKSTLDKVLLFTDKSDSEIIKDRYELIDKNKLSKKEYASLVKKYPLLRDEDLYLLEIEDDDDEELKELENIMTKPLLMVSMVSMDTKDSKKMINTIKGSILNNIGSTETINMDTDIFQMIGFMPLEVRLNMLKEVDKKLKDMPDMMVEQSSILITKSEYQAVGMNIKDLQNNYIIKTGLKMLLVAFISMVSTILVALLGSRVAANLALELRNKVFKKVTNFSQSEMNNFKTASLITRSTNDITQVQMLMVMLLRIVIYAPILGLGGVMKVLNTNTSMAWILGVAVLSILSVVIILFSIVMPKFKKMQKLVDKLNAVAREILTGIPVIRAFSNQKYEEKRFDKANKDLTKNTLFVNRVMGLMMPVMMFIMNIVCLTIVWRGAHSIDAGMMQVGDMMAFIQYTMQIIMSFLMISMVSIMLPRASVSMGRIDEVLDTDITVKDPLKPLVSEKDKGVVEFRNVAFKYPDSEEEVISNVNFKALAGETTAFIGSTGSGKSTLINLIPRFFDVTSGEILIDGINIKDMTLKSLRSKIGYVPQKGVLFKGTIATNLKYGNPDLTDSDMEKAVTIAQAKDFIDSSELGYNTPIAQSGSNVSGGQKQRLSIARAIAKNPNIYIFDDSFSALDFKTDAILRKELTKVTKESTVLIVAQRISTIMNAEQIVVLDEGEVVGIGTHKELLNKCPIYKQIALSQLGEEEL